MPSNDLIGDWNETPVWTIGASDSRLLTDAPNPFICASRRIAAFSSSLALEPDGENIRSPPKQRPEQLDLGLRRRLLGDRWAALIKDRSLVSRSTPRNVNLNGHSATVNTKPQGVYSAVAGECGKSRSPRLQFFNQFCIFNPPLQAAEPRVSRLFDKFYFEGHIGQTFDDSLKRCPRISVFTPDHFWGDFISKKK
jgi:hypothetical protein